VLVKKQRCFKDKIRMKISLLQISLQILFARILYEHRQKEKYRQKIREERGHE
jgi:hypothetical protein